MTKRIRGFDGLRALAVLAVFLGHRTPLHGHAIGHVGVLVFFALSGYLIVGILNAAKRRVESAQTTVGGEIARFFAHRTRRIFPIYFIMLAVVAVLALAGLPVAGWRWDSLPWHLAYLSNVYEGYVSGWQGALSHLWSLSIEEQFYLVAAPLLLALPSRWHARTCAAVVLAGIGGHLALGLEGANSVAIYTDSLTNFGFIGMGGWLRLNAERGAGGWLSALLWPLAPALLAMSLVSDPMANGVWLIVTPILAALFVGAVAQGQRSRMVALLELPPLVYLGRISYGFYLYHNLLWIDPEIPGRVGVIIGAGINFAASLGLAALSWWLVEAPILKGRAPWSRSTPLVA